MGRWERYSPTAAHPVNSGQTETKWYPVGPNIGCCSEMTRMPQSVDESQLAMWSIVALALLVSKMLNHMGAVVSTVGVAMGLLSLSSAKARVWSAASQNDSLTYPRWAW